MKPANSGGSKSQKATPATAKPSGSRQKVNPMGNPYQGYSGRSTGNKAQRSRKA